MVKMFWYLNVYETEIQRNKHNLQNTLCITAAATTVQVYSSKYTGIQRDIYANLAVVDRYGLTSKR